MISRATMLAAMTVFIISCQSMSNENSYEGRRNPFLLFKPLVVKEFRTGVPLFNATNKEEWLDACSKHIPAYCYYNFDPQNEEKYGLYYNMAALRHKDTLLPYGYALPYVYKEYRREDFSRNVKEFLGYLTHPQIKKIPLSGRLGYYKEDSLRRPIFVPDFIDTGKSAYFWMHLTGGLNERMTNPISGETDLYYTYGAFFKVNRANVKSADDVTLEMEEWMGMPDSPYGMNIWPVNSSEY